MLRSNYILISTPIITITLTFFTQLQCIHTSPLPLPSSSFEFVNNLHSYNSQADEYPMQPNEVLPIQPLLLYPKPRQLAYEGRQLQKDNDVIYVKLLKRRNYHPSKHLSNVNDIDSNDADGIRELTIKDIFYVKALANGQFSHHRLKWYRLPEFYAISVFHKGEQMA